MVLELLESVYDLLVGIIREHGIKETTIQIKRNSFCLIYISDFFDLIKNLDISEVESKIDISKLLYNINLVDMAVFYDSKHDDDYWVSTSTVIDIQASLGFYIFEQKKQGKIPSVLYWGREFRNWIGAEKENAIEERLQDYFASAVANAGTMYVCGLISAGCFDIIDDGFYYRRLSLIALTSHIEKRVVAALHAFLYYMLYSEDEKYVGTDLKIEALKFWEKNRNIYNKFIYDYADDIVKLLIENLNSEWRFEDNEGKPERIHDVRSRWIYYLLRRFDFRMRNRRQGGVLVLPEAVEDYCLFTIMYLSKYRIDSQPLRWMKDSDHNVDDFIKYIDNSNKKSIKKRLQDYTQFAEGEYVIKDDGRRREQTSLFIELYNQIIVGIRDLYKEKKVDEAREKEARFLKDKNEINNKISEWEHIIISAIKNAFSEDIDLYGNGKDIDFHDISLFHFTTYTDMVKDSINDTSVNRIIAALIDGYIGLLADEKWIDKKTRDEYIDDQEYIHYLIENDIGCMIGSEYLLKNNDYLMSEKFNSATKDFKWIKNVGCFKGMGVKKESVRFYIKDLKVDIKNSNAEYEKVRETNAEGQYFYEPIFNISIDFNNKEDLEEFVGQSRKIVEVTAKIAVSVYDEKPIGFYFENEFLFR